MAFKNIIIVLVVVAAIGGGALLVLLPDENDPEIFLPDQEGEAPEPAAPVDDLATVLSRVDDVDSVKYDIELVSPESRAEMHFALKGDRIRSEMTYDGQQGIILIDTAAQTLYNYMPAQNMAFRMDSLMAQEILGNSLKEQAHGLLSFDPVVVGRETIDGMDCLVVEYSIEGYDNKMWIWERHGLPIKMETTTERGLVQATAHNIEFVELPDSMFELPAGVQIINPSNL